jgi:hypothetical protein
MRKGHRRIYLGCQSAFGSACRIIAVSHLDEPDLLLHPRASPMALSYRIRGMREVVC